MNLTRRELIPALAAPLVAAGPKRPNFVFLFTDDHRFNAVNALGNPEVRTPNLDRLVNRGVAFTRTFIMGGTIPAVCAPSRAMLLTGQNLFHAHDNIIAPDQTPALRKRPFVTFPEVLRGKGYDTCGIGKWHNGPALYARSFSHGGPLMLGGMSDHLRVPVYDYDPGGRYPKEKLRTGEKFSSELFSDAALRFLRARDRSNPYLMYVAYTSPHDPRMAPKQFADMYSPDQVALPKNFLPQHPFDNGEMKVRDEMLAPFPRTPEVIRRHIAAYYAMISEVDSQIGRVLEAVDASGEADNTYILFAADNGLAVGQHGLMGKQNLYDHSMRVPLVIAGPGIPRGKRCQSLCHLHDVCPTIYELSGAAVPESVEARSLRPALRNPAAPLRDSVFSAYRSVMRSIRTDRWKLIRYTVEGRETLQLFDMQRDPWEITNLAGDASHANRVQEMKEMLRRRMKELDDPLAV